MLLVLMELSLSTPRTSYLAGLTTPSSRQSTGLSSLQPQWMELLNGETYPARYSAAYFCNPNGDTFIDTLPGTWENAGAKKYEGVTARQWLMKRLTLGHTPLLKETVV